ncbi:MAG: ribosome hibernation-promoting factor, HPF/YfiA family [Coriobacteriales bacterium]
MDIKVTGRKMQVSEALRDYAVEKVENSMKVFDISPMTAEVVLHMEKNRSISKPAVAEITLRTKGHVIRAEESEQDMYAALDLATDKVTRQLRKYKTKVIDRKTRSKGLKAVPVETGAGASPVADEDEAVVRTKYIDLQPLTEEEAVLQTDLSGHDFFVFLDAKSGEVNVIYHRKGGGYGVIKPKVEEEA